MKKFTAILLTVIMVASLFVSCNNSIEPTVIDETVSVSFSDATSRSLAASLEGFDKDLYWWAYAAQKADGTNLKSGETADYGKEGEVQVWINGDPNENNKGLGSVAGFSQGLWNFKLFAYKGTATAPVLAYQGEIKNVSLIKGSDNKVVVTVSPLATGNGTLKINNDITLKNFSEDAVATDIEKKYTVTALNSTVSIPPTNTSGDEWANLPVGAYKVTVEFKKDSITYGSGSVVATVYSNLTTEVSGFLKELVTIADFESDINPDVINKEASSTSIKYGTLTSTESTAPTVVNLTEDTSKIKASVPVTAAANIIKDVTENDTPNNNTSIEFALRVTTVDATNTSLNLEIGMQATVTEKDDANQVVRQTTEAVNNLSDIVTVTVQLQAGLKNVKVYHNNSENPMNSLNSAEDNAEGVFYNSNDGKLTIKTRSFSPFSITYDVPKFVAKIGNVKYTSLQGAINAISVSTESTVIEILSNIDLTTTATISGKGPIEIKLNGNVITGIGTRALLVEDGEVSITGPGTITVSQGISDSSSVIRVAGTDAREAKLTIGEDVTISSDYSYGITVFGPNKQTLIVNGSVKTKDVPAISGNGSSNFGETDITIKGSIEALNENAIYHPQAGKLTINGTVKGLGGIEAKSGTNISLGKNARVEATATSVSHDPNSNGCSTSGYAIVAVENSAYKGNPKFSISGGTYIGEIAVITDNTVEDSKKASINITGGTFSKNPRLYVPIGYKVEEKDDGFAVSQCKTHRLDFVQNVNTCEDCGTTFPILKKTENPDGTYKTSGLKSFAIITSGKYKLFDDVSNNRISIGHAISGTVNADIDLGGYTLAIKGDSKYCAFIFSSYKSDNVITFRNGTILERADNPDNLSSSLISINKANKMIFKPNLNIVCVKPNTTAILVENDGQLESSANITTKKGTAIQTNGSTTTADAAITITGGNITSDNVAIYLPSGKLSISGGTITGTTAVYTKGHNVTISGGTLVGKGKAADYAYNGSGCNPTGDALVVDSCNYPSGVPFVEISGGNFISEKNKAVGSYYGNGVTTPVTGFITGGTFSSDPSAYVASGNPVVNNNNGTWTVEKVTTN